MTRYVGPPSDARRATRTTKRTASLERRIVGTSASYEIKITSDDDEITVADHFIFAIPASVGGFALKDAQAFITTVGSSGSEVAINNLTTTTDMMATNITIDTSDFTSYAAAAPSVVAATPDNVVATADRVEITVVTAGTGAMGLGVILEFG